MLQPGGDFDFPREAFGPDLRGQLLMEHLDCNVAVVLQILGAEHGRHTAATQLTVEGVSIRERLP